MNAGFEREYFHSFPGLLAVGKRTFVGGSFSIAGPELQESICC